MRVLLGDVYSQFDELPDRGDRHGIARKRHHSCRHGRRIRLAKQTGERVMELLKENIRPKDILTPAAFENALRADMAIGCSSNTVLHIVAVSYAAAAP